MTIEAAELLLRGLPSPHAAGTRPPPSTDSTRAAAARAEKLALKLSGTKLLDVIKAEQPKTDAEAGGEAGGEAGDAGNATMDGTAGAADGVADGGASENVAVERLLAQLDGAVEVTDEVLAKLDEEAEAIKAAEGDGKEGYADAGAEVEAEAATSIEAKPRLSSQSDSSADGETTSRGCMPLPQHRSHAVAACSSPAPLYASLSTPFLAQV